MTESTPVDISFWKTAYEEHGDAILGFLARRTRRREEAEDLLQETFIRAIRSGGALRDVERVRAYLISIAYRLLLSDVRRKKPVLFADIGTGEDRPGIELPTADADSPEMAAHLSRVEDRVRGALGGLSRDLRTAFELAVFEQKSYAEIGESQGWNLNRVRINVHRARKKMIVALGDLIQERRP